MTNTHEINDLIEFVHKHNITIKQFAYCMLLHHDKVHSRIEGSHKIARPLSKLYKYHQNIEHFGKTEIQDLVDKKLLKQTGKTFKPDMLEVTDKFKKQWYGDKFKIDELIEEYPSHVANFNHPGKPKIPLCTFKDYNKLKNRYNSLVKTYKMHERVLDIVRWGKENDEIKIGLEKFVNSKYWEDLRELKEDMQVSGNQTLIE